MITVQFTCDDCGLYADPAEVRYLSEHVFRYKPAGWKKRARWQNATQIICPSCVDQQTRAKELQAQAAELRAEAAALLKH